MTRRRSVLLRTPPSGPTGSNARTAGTSFNASIVSRARGLIFAYAAPAGGLGAASYFHRRDPDQSRPAVYLVCRLPLERMRPARALKPGMGLNSRPRHQGATKCQLPPMLPRLADPDAPSGVQNVPISPGLLRFFDFPRGRTHAASTSPKAGHGAHPGHVLCRSRRATRAISLPPALGVVADTRRLTRPPATYPRARRCCPA